MPAVIALDLSITATGVATTDGTLTTWRSKATGDERLHLLRLNLSNLLYTDHPEVVVIEDLPTHAHGAGITGMVHGVIRELLISVGIPYTLVTPASLKKYATGKGNSPKPELRMSLYKRMGIDEPDDNAVDAAWLRLMAMDAYGAPQCPMPAVNVAALASIVWPVLGGVAA